MADGRLVALIIATPAAAVIHERFHARLSELERADVRAALATNAEGLGTGEGGATLKDGAQAIGRYRGAVLVSHVEGGLVLHGAGTGDCDELTVSRALRSLGSALKSSLGAGKRPPTPAAAFEGYGKVVLALDDLAYEGVLDVTGREGRERAARLRGGAEA